MTQNLFSRSPVDQTASLEAVRFDVLTGLVPVVVQSGQDGTVLMVAYANREALKRTLGTGFAWFWSRSRNEYWQKGATSGHTQRVQDVRLDCDGDAIVYIVQAAGPACHTGENTCFYRSIEHQADTVLRVDQPTVVGEVVVDVANVAILANGRDASLSDAWDANDSVLHRLWAVVSQRHRDRPAGSYTTYLFTHGVDKVAKKVAEESAEVVIAAKNALSATGETNESGQAELARESADLIFHLLALWKMAGVTPGDVVNVLDARHREK